MGATIKFVSLILALALLASSAAFAKEKVPADIRVFIKNADTCEHFAGEWDSDLDAARKKEIEHGVDKYCMTAQRQWKKITAKYRTDGALRTLIAQHAYDSVRSYRK